MNLKDYEVKALSVNNYDDIILYFRRDCGIRAKRWEISQSDADIFHNGFLIIEIEGNFNREAITMLLSAIPNDFVILNGNGKTAIRFAPSPKTSVRDNLDWL